MISRLGAMKLTAALHRRTLAGLTAVTLSVGPVTATTMASSPDTTGYRKASSAERAEMRRARNLRLTRAFGFYIGRHDAKVGVVCGYRDGKKEGNFVLRTSTSSRRWKAHKAVTSGEIQGVQAICVGF